MAVFVANTNVLDLIGLKSEVEDVFLNSATVSFTVTDKALTPIAGSSWPLSMDYVDGSNGNYRGILPAAVSLVKNHSYVAVIEVAAGSERIGHWEFSFKAFVRTGVTEET